MRKIFQYSALFYFVLATQCQSIESGTTIAVDPSSFTGATIAVDPSSFTGTTIAVDPIIVGGNPATWSPINKLDAVINKEEPKIHIDPVMESTVFLTKEEPMMYAAQVDPKVQVNPIPMAMMMRGAPLMTSATPLEMVKRTATAAPKAVKNTTAAAKTITAKPQSNIMGQNPGNLSPRMNAVATTAPKTAISTPKPQAKPITFMKSRKLIGF